MFLFALSLLIAGLMVPSSGQNPEYYAQCEGYLNQVVPALDAGGISQVRTVAYSQYLDNPSGPYVFCFDGTPDDSADDVGAMRLVVHPFLANETLATLVQTGGGDDEYLDVKKELFLGKVNFTQGQLFNFSERFSQAESEAANLAGDEAFVPGSQVQQLVGFIKTDPLSGDLVNCGCRYTGVPPGDRLNENAVAALDSDSSAGMMAVGLGSLVTLLGVWML